MKSKHSRKNDVRGGLKGFAVLAFGAALFISGALSHIQLVVYIGVAIGLAGLAIMSAYNS